jgi:DNA-binding response OmpR family regulator
MISVLVADDDPDIRELVALKLGRAGYTVVSAADGPGALAAMREHLPRLAVLDVMMPQLSGLDVCREVRADPALAGTAVILLTAKAQPADIETGYSAGADDYIVKPFSPRELLSRISAVLARMAP